MPWIKTVIIFPITLKDVRQPGIDFWLNGIEKMKLRHPGKLSEGSWVCVYIHIVFFLFRAAPTAHGGSQARG